MEASGASKGPEVIGSNSGTCQEAAMEKGDRLVSSTLRVHRLSNGMPPNSSA